MARCIFDLFAIDSLGTKYTKTAFDLMLLKQTCEETPVKKISTLLAAACLVATMANAASAAGGYKFKNIGAFTAKGSMTVTSIAISNTKAENTAKFTPRPSCVAPSG